MYQIGDLIVYGGTGVCRVEAVDTPKPWPGEAARQYYLLKPLYLSLIHISEPTRH